MSSSLPYTYGISHGPYTALKFRLNDIPFYRITDTKKPTGVSENCVADHLLVRGENTFTFEIHESDERYFAKFSLQINHDRSNNIFDLVWPLIYNYIPAVTSQPFSYTLSFHIPDHTFRSAYLDATPQVFGVEGDRGLHEAVLNFYDTLVRADYRGYLREMRLKSSELRRAYPDSPLFTDEYLDRVFSKRFSQGLEVEPVRIEDLHFESCAGGRVAFVTRKNGERPILALTPDGQGMHHDLWLTHFEGAWQIFR
jgi:hypothetical protein